MKGKVSLFVTGFIQVLFVAMNTYFLAKELFFGVMVASFLISFIWSINVKKVAFGNNSDRIIYALGATAGSLTGLWASSIISKTLY